MASFLTLAAVILALAVAVVLGLALAYVPMRLLLGQIARNITQFIQRQRERRREARNSPDRRHL